MDKNMIKRVIHTTIALFAVAVALVSCREDDWQGTSSSAREGYVALRFSADIPAMQEVATRSVDPDGGGVQDMTLFCFDSYGLFISTATATVTSTGDLGGDFSAEVPDNTRTIHFLANQNMTEFEEDQFRSKSESEVIALLEGSSGRMIYWARFACDPDNKNSIAQQMEEKGGSITMIRNHAQVSVANPENEWIMVTGFVAYNTNAFGTVAPYHPEKGFDFTWPSDDDPFVTLPKNDAKMSDVTDVTTATRQYIFESGNSSDDPVSIIIRGHLPGETEELYYRVMLVDDKGDQILVRRNHHYKLNIEGKLSFGQATFAEALEAAATNNVWISISDEVNEVEDADYVLTVDKTAHVIGAEATTGQGTYTLTYTIKGKNGKEITADDIADVTWIDNLVARQEIDANQFEIKDGVGTGSIRLSLLPLNNNEKLEGTLLVKKGRLQRKIKIITIKEQSFVPSWVGTQVYGEMNNADPTKDRSHVTVMFTVPETCPTELFPMNVYISVGELDIRTESGMALTVLREGDKEWYSSGDIKPEPDYKFLYKVEKPGVQRVYFENILSQEAGVQKTLYIEAEHFKTMEREFTFSNSQKSITVTGLKAYNAAGGGADGFADDELILYRLVPQKKHANVQFDLQLREKTGDEIEDDQKGNLFNAGAKDEFLLYSQYLDYYEDDETGDAGVTGEFPCKFYPNESATWWQQYNPNGGRMLMFKPRNPDNTGDEVGKYSIYMKTNRAKSAEVVRIASNQSDAPAVITANNGVDGLYSGGSYRSVTFELANYNPFRFGAKVAYDGQEYGEEAVRDDATADVPEVITDMTWTYEPEQDVDIAIDVTSFMGSDGNSVDPFGEQFEIYIDAPMLEIDESRLQGYNLNKEKLKKHPTIPGRFVYTVDENREKERKFGKGEALNKDNTATSAVNQNGERKLLPFVTSSIVSAGNIVISSDEQQVVFYSKTFRVANSSITGKLQYQAADGTTQPVPADAFVSFERIRNGSRIGAITVTADGQYELRLRKEYAFNWHTDAVELHYEANGVVYHKTYNSLAQLFSASDVVLTAATGN